MSYQKESLEKLLILIEEICKEPQNDWFKIDLQKSLELNAFDSDFGSYFKLLRKQFKLKANIFYEKVPDKVLKVQLIEDFVKMYWYQVNNEVPQLFVYAFYQMENMLNFYIRKSNAYEKIKINKNFYAHSFNDKFNVICYNSFFFKNNAGDSEKEINKISIWPKIIYWIYDTRKIDFLTSNNSNFSNLVNIRNLSNHKDSHNKSPNRQDYTKPAVEYIKNSDFSSFGFYTNLLKEMASSLISINTLVEVKPFEHTSSKGPELKIVGFVDPKTFKK